MTDNKDFCKTIDNLYFTFLCENILTPSLPRSAMQILEILHTIDYNWVLEMDENRLGDAVILKDRFVSNNGYLDDVEECLFARTSVLEVLIGIATQVCYILEDSNYDLEVPVIFWRFLDNLSLNVFAFNDFSDDIKEIGVLMIIGRWLEKDIDFNGSGGIFPLKEPHEDQRYVEIWYQMFAYLDENYPDIEDN